MPLTPTSRKRKSRYATNLTDTMKSYNLNIPDLIEVVKLSLSQQGILECLQSERKPTRTGRSKIPVETRKNAWDFWHGKATESTLTSRPAKLRVIDKNKIQCGLEFLSSVNIITQRNREFYESCWLTVDVPYKELYHEFLQHHNYISYGSFIALKPFYIRGVTHNDIEMCCCKKHLHARWVISAIIECTENNNISLDFDSYGSFFDFLTKDCEKLQTTYIDWNCTQTRKVTCLQIAQNWEDLKLSVQNAADDILVQFTHFVKELVTTKHGIPTKRLKAKSEKVNMKYLINFLDGMLSDIIHHRNQLKHYRTCIHDLKKVYDTAVLDIDFSENLSIPVKFEPQSLHWSHEQITVHSGISKQNEMKEYHQYLSNDKCHDQVFVRSALEEMLGELTLFLGMVVIVESDNCSSQYKSAEHFHDLQELATKYQITIIRIFGIAGHGKGEVDHVGGLAKISLRRGIASEVIMRNAEEMVQFLKLKFDAKQNPSYIIKEIQEERLEIERTRRRLKSFKTIDGSSIFQAMCFKANQSSFKASPYLCVCPSCQDDFGSCLNFNTYSLEVHLLKENILRSGDELQVDTDAPKDFFLVDSIVAIAAAETSCDTMWFVKVTQEVEFADKNMEDGYGNIILMGQHYLKGNFLEREYMTTKGHIFKVNKKKETMLFKETILYPFVNFQERKKGLFLSNNDYVDILLYTQNSEVTGLVGK